MDYVDEKFYFKILWRRFKSIANGQQTLDYIRIKMKIVSSVNNMSLTKMEMQRWLVGETN
jgi:hypothetical protein